MKPGMVKRRHRAGWPWRVLAWNPKTDEKISLEGPAGSEFDELVISRWFHLEQMDASTWWMNVGGVTVWVRADGRNGRPSSVAVYGPNDYDLPVAGCDYKCVWTEAADEA